MANFTQEQADAAYVALGESIMKVTLDSDTSIGHRNMDFMLDNYNYPMSFDQDQLPMDASEDTVKAFFIDCLMSSCEFIPPQPEWTETQEPTV